MSLHLPTVVAILASAAASQGLVSPAHFASAEGNTNAYTGPGSTTAPDRCLQVHDDLRGVARTLGSVAFRRDGATTAAYGAYNTLCDIFLSTSAKTSATISSTFESNHGTNKTQVGSYQLASFPATTHSGPGEPFVYRIAFAQPWLYDGAGPLCLDLKFLSKTNTATAHLDYQSTASSTDPYPYDEIRGTGCKATGYTTAARLTGGSNPNWPAGSMMLSWNGSYLPKSAVVFLCLGASGTDWLGLPLPLELPGTATMPSGTCTVYTDWTVQLPALTNTSGGLTQNLGFTVNAFMNGLSIFSQVVALDAAANVYGGIMTNLVQHQVIAPYTLLPVSAVLAAGGLPVNGTVHLNEGYIVKFD